MFTGKLLRLLRVLKGIKQDSLGKQIGITQQAISELEKSEEINKEKMKLLINEMGYSSSEVKSLQKLLNKFPSKK